ncbi:MAG: hypothetical protein IPG17_34755 [Sandaracinaceae bacterium]|nr:hypothetical protein [Sandaracinaceae bacterium]
MKPSGLGPGGVGVGIIPDVQGLLGQHAEKPAGHPERGAVGLLDPQRPEQTTPVYPRAEPKAAKVPGRRCPSWRARRA